MKETQRINNPTQRLVGGAAVVIAALAGMLLGASPSFADRKPGAAPQSAQPQTTVATTTTVHDAPGKANGKPSSPPGRSSNGSAQGIVQSVEGSSVVVTQLDGTEVSVTIGPGTRVFVNGLHATVATVKPGFVVSTAWSAGRTRLLEAFDLSGAGKGVTVGVVRSVSGRVVVVAESDGSVVKLRVGPKTRLVLDGDATTLAAVQAGDTIVLSTAEAKAGSAAGQLRFLRPV